MSTTYQPILAEPTRQIFADYISALNIPLIDYIAIGVQDTVKKQSASIMSLPEWQKHFFDNGYAEYDPIRKVALHTKRNVIPFSEIDYLDSFGKDIMHQRACFGIKDGLILMDRHPNYNYMVTLGTGYSQFDAFEFLKNYYYQIKEIIPDLIKIIERDSMCYKNSKPQSSLRRCQIMGAAQIIST